MNGELMVGRNVLFLDRGYKRVAHFRIDEDSRVLSIQHGVVCGNLYFVESLEFAALL